MIIEIKRLNRNIIDDILNSFAKYSIKRSKAYYDKCLAEQKEAKRDCFIAYIQDEVVGTIHLIYKSKYASFRENSIPEN